MTILYLRCPASASIDTAAPAPWPYALAQADGRLVRQGVAMQSVLRDAVATAHRVVLILAAADVSLLQLSAPPLSEARLASALPALVEEHVLGDVADCALSAGPALEQGQRCIAVTQRAWLQSLVQSLLAQGARAVSAVPGQLCLPHQDGALTAHLEAAVDGLELTVRYSAASGVGMSLVAEPLAVLHTLTTLAGGVPLKLYLSPALLQQYHALLARLDTDAAAPAIQLVAEDWASSIAACRSAGIDLVPTLGITGLTRQSWQRWRRPAATVALTLLLNVAGLNLHWQVLRHQRDALQGAIQQSFHNVYPNEASLYPLQQMRRNLAVAKADSGLGAPDEFTVLSAALAEAIPQADIIESLSYRQRRLQIKFKADRLDPGTLDQARSRLAAHRLSLQESAPGLWQLELPHQGAPS